MSDLGSKPTNKPTDYLLYYDVFTMLLLLYFCLFVDDVNKSIIFISSYYLISICVTIITLVNTIYDTWILLGVLNVLRLSIYIPILLKNKFPIIPFCRKTQKKFVIPIEYNVNNLTFLMVLSYIVSYYAWKSISDNYYAKKLGTIF